MWAASLKVMAGTQHLLPTVLGESSTKLLPLVPKSCGWLSPLSIVAMQNGVSLAKIALVGRWPAPGATVHPPRPVTSPSLDLVGLLADAPSAPVPPPFISPAPPHDIPPRTYLDVGTEPSVPTFHDAAIDTPPSRVFTEAAIGTRDIQDTAYGNITDPFARDLGRLLPWSLEREQELARIIWLDDWEAHMNIFEQIPSFLRVYLHALFMFFRPGLHPAFKGSIPPGFAPIFNLFAHSWSGWNAISTPHGPREPDFRRRYYHLTHAQLHRTAPLDGRGYIMEPASSFS
ncbi:hypothetical protein DFH07DRAFT_1062751 [Mycena maculata]|uniref:Uncharacterized protein n=1 Tax=Mycena maculata TaxID=230809 RepID=A0AAD7IND6_9AGAR|nr:hypothetical protein DFH07DRAFT_1062751 [Mycena maculata]